MSDILYICNAALDLVGQGQILALDDDTPAANKCALHVAPAIREVLNLGKFKCSHKQAVLSRVTTDPRFQWTYAYQLPNDFIRTVQVVAYDTAVSEGVPILGAGLYVPEYEIQGKQLFTDQSAVQLVYVADPTMPPNDMAAITPALIELMIVKLAQKMAWSFQQSATLKQSLEQEYMARRRVVLSQDAQETKNPIQNPLLSSNWLRDRVASTNG